MQTNGYISKICMKIIMALLLLIATHTILAGCATTLTKSSGVITSREATDIWHSYEILPNYRYYYAGPDSQPDYIIGIDDTYQLTSKLWKPVELTPKILKNWLNFTRPRVGYSQSPYGAFIMSPGGERIGLWYSVRDWRLKGSATVGENYQVSVIEPSLPTDRRENTKLFYK